MLIRNILINLNKKNIYGNYLRKSNNIFTTVKNESFWERDRKSGYQKVHNENDPKFKSMTQKKLILDGLKELRQEIQLWQNEVQEKLKCDPILVFRPGETDVVWSFNKEKDETNDNNIKNWICTSDQDNNEGFSSCTFQYNTNGKALFSGILDSKLPKDGKIKKAGYCNIKSMRARKSFKREHYHDWSQYNTLVLRVRGDGRSYLINLTTEGYFDIMWNDIYHYILYTRGGPHWQTAKIPFSKFFLSSKGRVQDRQFPIPLDRVTNFGFSVGARGGHEGPFKLEIDYIGVEFDPSHHETFAYEMYKQQKYIVGT